MVVTEDPDHTERQPTVSTAALHGLRKDEAAQQEQDQRATIGLGRLLSGVITLSRGKIASGKQCAVTAIGTASVTHQIAHQTVTASVSDWSIGQSAPRYN